MASTFGARTARGCGSAPVASRGRLRGQLQAGPAKAEALFSGYVEAYLADGIPCLQASMGAGNLL